MTRAKGFTLIELLVVIAIIAVLAAVLFPVYLSAQNSAKKSGCQSNLEQLSKSFTTYIDDFNCAYPTPDYNNDTYWDSKQHGHGHYLGRYFFNGVQWRWPMRKYVGFYASYDPNGDNTQTTRVNNNILACPSDSTSIAIYDKTSYVYSACFYIHPDVINSIPDAKYIRWGYKSTAPYTAPVDNTPYTTSVVQSGMIKYPSKKVMVTEYWAWHNSKSGWYDLDTATPGPWSGARNYLFADGHVAFIYTKTIHAALSPTVDRTRSLPDINLTTNGVFGKDVD